MSGGAGGTALGEVPDPQVALQLLRQCVGFSKVCDQRERLLTAWHEMEWGDGIAAIIVDEAGMALAGLMSILICMASLEGCPLFLVGDPAQLAANVRSAMARALARLVS